MRGNGAMRSLLSLILFSTLWLIPMDLPLAKVVMIRRLVIGGIGHWDSSNSIGSSKLSRIVVPNINLSLLIIW